MSLNNFVILIALFLVGCASFPTDRIFQPKSEIDYKCVHVSLKRFREGRVTSKIEDFPVTKLEELKYRKSLRAFGLETDCENPIGVFEFTYTLHGGIRLPSVDLIGALLSFFSMGIIPSKSDLVVEISYTRNGSSNVRSATYLLGVTQWRSIFLIPKEVEQERVARNIYGVDNYLDAIVMAKTAELVFKEIDN